MAPSAGEGVAIRQPSEADHGRVVELVDGWWGRAVRHQLPRLWFRHFAATSAIAEAADGTIAGFAVGFVSPDRPTEGYLHLVGVAPPFRRRGIGRALVERFAQAARAGGATRLSTTAWPGDRAALAFLAAIGFVPVAGPGAQRLYGTPSYTDWDHEGDDRVVLDRPM